MRMRPKKNREKRLAAVQHLIAELEDGYVDIKKTFGNSSKPLFLEIGCGKGGFVTQLSKQNQETNILAIERVSDVLMMAMEKSQKEECQNIKFLKIDANNIDIIIPEKSILKLFLNFSDPWPKKGDAKKRLTHPNFLNKYKKILKPDGKIFFKTDNRPLFDFSIESFEQNNFVLKNVIFDLHNHNLNQINIQTEYEKTFSEKGFNINYLEAEIG